MIQAQGLQRNPIIKGGMGDLFTDLQKMGQGIIDEGASAIGIEKGGAIDKAATTAADIAKKTTGVGKTSGNGFIDNEDFATFDKITGGLKPAAATTTGAAKAANPAGTALDTTSRSTGSSGAAVSPSSMTAGEIASSDNLLVKVNPLATGAVVTGAAFAISRRVGLSLLVGVGTLLAQQAYRANRQ